MLYLLHKMNGDTNMDIIHIRIATIYRKLLKITAAERNISMTQLMGEILSEYFGKTKGITE